MSNHIDNLMLSFYQEGRTMQNIATLFGVSRERVRQRLLRLGVTGINTGRGPGGKKPVTVEAWQVRRAVELVKESNGTINCAMAAWLFSIPVGYVYNMHNGNVPWRATATRGEKGKRSVSNHRSAWPGKLWLLQDVWREVRLIVLCEAWRDGASIKDLALLLNMSVQYVGVTIHRARSMGYDIPYRYDMGTD